MSTKLDNVSQKSVEIPMSNLHILWNEPSRNVELVELRTE